jgi:hypothetical protein
MKESNIEYSLRLPIPSVLSKKSNAVYSLNTHNRTHYRQYSSIKNKYKDLYLKELEKHDKVLLVTAKIKYQLWLRNKRYIDLDNSIFVKKFLQDVMVENGYLIEDNCSVLTKNTEEFGGVDKNCVGSYFIVTITGTIRE